MSTETAWQLRMFNKSLKKKMRYGVLKKHLGPIRDEEKCLLVTCGDNNGAMNYYLREFGGSWSFADLEDTCVVEMSELLGEEVRFLPDDNLGYADAYFDRIVTIDVHAHSTHHEQPGSVLEKVNTQPLDKVFILVRQYKVRDNSI